MSSSPNSAHRVSDTEILDFASTWVPFGGGTDEEIFINFGLGADEYFDRLIKILEKGRTRSGLDLQQVIKLARMRRATPPEQTLM